MIHYKHRLPLLVVCAILSTAFGGCKTAHKSDATSQIRVNLGTEPPSLDWSIATDHVSFNVIANLMVGLTEFDKELKPAPVIAKSWEVSDGGKKIVFKLRDDVEWTDGKKVRAQDFEFSWKRLLDPKTASQYAYILFDIVNAADFAQGKLKDPSQVGVKAVDDHTLAVTLNHPAAYFLAITTFEVTYPQRQDVIEKFDNRWTQPGNIITNGPFTLASWKQQNEIELRANNKYFRGKPNIDKVTMYMVNEKTTALTMYEQGNLDFMDESHSIPTLDKPRLAKLPEYKLVPQLRGEYYGFAVDRKPFDNPKLRRAFSLAIDREVFPKILQGGKTPATSWIPPGMLAHNPKIGLAYNPEQARRFLAEAGYSEGKGLPPIVLGYNTQEDHKLVAEAIQAMWQKNLNVVVKIENQEWKVYLKKLQTDPFVVHRAGWGADYPDPDNFMKLFTSNSGNNHGRWKNPKYDQLLDQAASESDSAKRVQLYDQAQRLLTETDAAIAPLFWKAEATMLSPKFTGLEYNSMARMDLRNVKPVTNNGR
ncbi:MAG TPA: peptide ABC transporter substrate-binding protein [Candidatus Binatia bacterium]|nr:peptide ABC transporter substrate-binding protein [Candidatus Binatia bacterium]